VLAVGHHRDRLTVLSMADYFVPGWLVLSIHGDRWLAHVAILRPGIILMTLRARPALSPPKCPRRSDAWDNLAVSDHGRGLVIEWTANL